MSFIIIKTGSTLANLRSKRGDFEDWFLEHLDMPIADIQIINVQNNESLPHYLNISGVLITGSHAMVSHQEQWSETAASWIKGAVDHNIPVLGVCFGHQLLAYALGGQVGPNPNGLEAGTMQLNTTVAANTDPLLSGFKGHFSAQAVHFESVLSLPNEAVPLAGNAHDPHHAFRYKDNAWGFQFHPEFDVEIITEYIKYVDQDLAEQQIDSQALIDNLYPTDGASNLLSLFSKQVKSMSYHQKIA
jgi:GMP synthase (glutamine-hydrolysing)